MKVSGQCHTQAALLPGNRAVTNRTGGWVGPRAGLDGFGNTRPRQDLIPGPSCP
jgi:hypothetical protein